MSSNIKRRAALPAPETEKRQKGFHAEQLTRNAVIAAFAFLLLVGVRESVPGGKPVLQAMQQAVESEWDENVGKLSFVNGKIGEAVAVFSRGFSSDTQLTAPISATPVQAWSAEAPYLLYENAGNVYAAAAGEVTQIAHDDNSEYIVRIIHDNGLNTIYYGLKSCFVQEGEAVSSQSVLGKAGASFAFETQRNGRAVDPAAALVERDQTP